MKKRPMSKHLYRSQPFPTFRSRCCVQRRCSFVCVDCKQRATPGEGNYRKDVSARLKNKTTAAAAGRPPHLVACGASLSSSSSSSMNCTSQSVHSRLGDAKTRVLPLLSEAIGQRRRYLKYRYLDFKAGVQLIPNWPGSGPAAAQTIGALESAWDTQSKHSERSRP